MQYAKYCTLSEPVGATVSCHLLHPSSTIDSHGNQNQLSPALSIDESPTIFTYTGNSIQPTFRLQHIRVSNKLLVGNRDIFPILHTPNLILARKVQCTTKPAVC